MDIKAKFDEAQEYVGRRVFEGAIQIYKEIMEASEGEDAYYWALKHYGDVIGYIGLKDYFQSIDVYQKIIMEYENEEDSLYEMCQIDTARAYLELGIDMIQNFDNTISMFEPEDDKMITYMKQMIKRRNEFIEQEAEVIYKSKL